MQILDADKILCKWKSTDEFLNKILIVIWNDLRSINGSEDEHKFIFYC